jgi:putative phosphoserine phosphatase / 1-acylglycerol-3-phosphate O-acyltransferase
MTTSSAPVRSRSKTNKASSVMSDGVAFVDLDRTLLAGASGPVISEALREVGFRGRPFPGENVLFWFFNTFGETMPSMLLAKQAAGLAKGKERRMVQEAARIAAPKLVALLQPYAVAMFEEHRAAGRRIVLATTTPYDMIKPFADLLQLDDVLATRYGVNADGTYDGTIAGHFVWNNGKLAAAQEWAAANGADLQQSYAYSDSVFDTPLLSAVGHPVVVNPDPSMVVVAAARRWPTQNLGAPPDAKPPALGAELQRLVTTAINPRLMIPFARFDIDGVENIPRSGPAIVVANHRSYFDALVVALVIAKSGRSARFLGKKEVFDVPIIGQLAKALGGIRVERASGSDEPLRAAADALLAGDVVALMPQGTIPRGAGFYDPHLKGRWGAAKLAEMTGAPVIPIGLWGTEKVWPRASRLPNVLNIANPPTVSAHVGQPVELKRRNPDRDTQAIMRAIMDLLPPESRHKITPTAEQIALANPPGAKQRNSKESESARRPGTD